MKKNQALDVVAKLREINFWDGLPRELAHPRRAGVTIELRVVNADTVQHMTPHETARLGPQLRELMITSTHVLAIIVKKGEWCDVIYKPLQGGEKTLAILELAVNSTNALLDSKNCLQLPNGDVKDP